MTTDSLLRSTDVPVLILNFNGWDDTFANIAAMQPYLSNLWLVDNGSDHDRTAEARARFPSIRTLRLPRNGGWAAGYNQALSVVAREGHDAAYLLNNDAVAAPGAVESAVAALRADENCAAVGSIILTHGGRRLSFDGEYFYFKSERERASVTFSPAVRPARVLHGAGFALSMTAFAELGPFPEEYFLYWEEADWFIAARQRGWTLLVDGSSVVMHTGEASNSAHNSRYYRTRNRFLALQRGIAVSGGEESLVSLVAEELVRGSRGDAEGQKATRDGLVDGLLGRFGKRRPPWRPPVLTPIILSLKLLVRWHQLQTRLRAANRGRGPFPGLPERALSFATRSAQILRKRRRDLGLAKYSR